MFRQKKGQFVRLVIVLSLFLMQIQAISNLESNVQNAITEEERRGADSSVNHNHNHNQNDVSLAKKNAKLIDDGVGDKKIRGIHGIQSPSASYKTTQYFVPSGFDSHLGSSGHASSGHSGGGYLGSTSGYDYVGGGGGHAPSHGGTAPSSGLGHHHSHHHNGPSGYSPSSTGFGGYGLSHGGYNHGGSGGGGVHIGGHIGGGQHGQFGGNAVGHSASGGIHSALALKGLLIPLAGIALLGAAAALSTNPVLLQLGVVNGRRRRRSITATAPPHYPAANPHVQPVSNY